MLYKDMSGNTRFYVRGTEEMLKDFTIDLAWYHSALAIVASVNEHSNGEMTLNLICYPEHYGSTTDLCERNLRYLAKKHNVLGFATWDEYRALEASA